MTNLARRLQPNTPTLRLIAMPDPIDERRDTPTLEAPPLSESEPERKTNPPDASAEAHAEAFVRDALRAPKGATAETIKELAEHELVTLYRTAIGMHESLLGASGLLEQNRRNTVEDIARVVDRGIDRVWERVAPRLDKQDGKIELLTRQLAEVKKTLTVALERVDELELALGLKEKRDAAEGSTPPPAVAP